MSIDKGLRFNEGKTRVDLLPEFATRQMAEVFTFGATKYAERNWERGMKWSKVIASLKRHTMAVERGEDYDKETGLLHAAHIMANASFLTEYYKIYPQGDDRTHTYLNMPRIGLDVDDVVCDFIGGFGKKYGLDTPHNWLWSYDNKNRFEKMAQNEQEYIDFYMCLEPKIMPESIPFEPVCYITSRNVPKLVTETWIEKNGFPCAPVYTVGHDMSKVEAAIDAKVDVFVDDRFENFVELNNAGICTYLYDAPHNQRYEVGHKRIYKLSDIIDKI